MATPGRLLDLTHQRALHFDELEVLVLDEADRMVDMGFADDIKKIIERLPADRQKPIIFGYREQWRSHLCRSFLSQQNGSARC